MCDVNCIFCHNDFVPGKDGEHIIPESIGGSLTIKEVCSSCNSQLNQRFEEKFKNEFVIELKRHQLNIRGKRDDDPPFPFKGYVETDISAECRLDKDFGPSLKTDVKMSKVDNDTFRFDVSVDASKKEEAIKSLRRKLPKCISELHPDYTSFQIEEETNKYINNFEEYCNKPGSRKIVKPKLKYRVKPPNLDIFILEFVKIAYEFTFFQFGKSFLEETISIELKDFLLGKSNNVEQYIKGINLEKVILDYSPEKHYLFILDDKCIVSLFGFGMAITVINSEIKKVTSLNSRIFIFDPSDATYVSNPLIGYLNKKLTSSFMAIMTSWLGDFFLGKNN